MMVEVEEVVQEEDLVEAEVLGVLDLMVHLLLVVMVA